MQINLLTVRPNRPATSPAPVAPFFTSHLAEPALQTARLAVCAQCPQNQAGNCQLCRNCGGRPVTAKVKRLDETCPLKQWPKPEVN